MVMSNFTNFLDGVTIRGVPILQAQPGKVFWVNNSSVLPTDGIAGSNGNPGNYLKPFSTIDYAIGKCKASRGDIICVMPGHAETISSATALAADVAGVAIVGLGQGSLRPTLTLDTATTATIGVSAANISFKNLIITANFADIVAAFTVTAANCVIEDCFIKATATNMNFLNVVDTNTTDNSADGLTILNCDWIEPDLATLSLVNLDSTTDRMRIEGNYVHLGVNNNKAALVTIATGKIVTRLKMFKNRVYRLNTDTATGAILLHTDGSTNTGIVAENFAQHADTAAELLITASSGLGVFDNKASGVAGASGYLLPAADS
jgi:hypothetical protein